MDYPAQTLWAGDRVATHGRPERKDPDNSSQDRRSVEEWLRINLEHRPKRSPRKCNTADAVPPAPRNRSRRLLADLTSKPLSDETSRLYKLLRLLEAERRPCPNLFNQFDRAATVVSQDDVDGATTSHQEDGSASAFTAEAAIRPNVASKSRIKSLNPINVSSLNASSRDCSTTSFGSDTTRSLSALPLVR
jgi:hypothetical protein